MEKSHNVTGCITTNSMTLESRQYDCYSCPHDKDRAKCPIGRVEIVEHPIAGQCFRHPALNCMGGVIVS
jgi:hypothetical protein